MNKETEQNKRATELSAELFLTTALQLAEQSGDMQKVSLRGLGKALNVDPTAVYRYFPNKAALVEAMMKRLMVDFLPSDEELEGDWRARLTALLRHAYQVFSTYPALTIRLPSSPDARIPVVARLTELGLEALKDAGLSDEHVVLFHELLYIFALGIGQVDAQYEEDLEGEKRVMRDYAATLAADDFPNFRGLAHLMVAENEDMFQLVLEIYLNAIERYARGNINT